MAGGTPITGSAMQALLELQEVPDERVEEASKQAVGVEDGD